MNSPVFRVHAHRDPETGYWWAESDDVPGLVTEAPTFEELERNILDLVPELLAANRPDLALPAELPVSVVAESRHTVRRAG